MNEFESKIKTGEITVETDENTTHVGRDTVDSDPGSQMKAAIRDKREKMIAAGAEKNYILVRSLRAEIKTMEAALCKVEK